jgi:Flp pilus assembly protein CpaB
MKTRKLIQIVLVLALLIGAVGSVAKSFTLAQATSAAAQRTNGLTMAESLLSTGFILGYDDYYTPCVGWNSGPS